MPDITMCSDDLCPKAYNCYRHRFSGTKPSEYRQSMFVKSPRKDNELDCDYYWMKNNES